MKPLRKLLAFRRDTIRVLGEIDLHAAVGGKSSVAPACGCWPDPPPMRVQNPTG